MDMNPTDGLPRSTVYAPASMLRKNVQLSKHARLLWLTMLSVADKAGELRVGNRWIKAAELEHLAEMCRRNRLAAMRELVAAGLATYTRMRVSRVVRGRSRELLGEAHYTVCKP